MGDGGGGGTGNRSPGPFLHACSVGFSVTAESGHLSLVVVLGLLTVVASLVAEHHL